MKIAKLFKGLVHGESGQALPAVLALLALGGLTVVPTIDYVATGLNSSRALRLTLNGTYAAEAGVEYAIWRMQNAMELPTALPENVNGMRVAIQAEAKGTYTIEYGQLVQTEGHSDYLDVASEAVWDAGAGAYLYTISVTWQPGSGAPTIHLTEVGIALPLGYNYQTGSAAGFTENLSLDEPETGVDARGAVMLRWPLDTPLPSVSQDNPVATQSFYATGSEGLQGDYGWAVANRTDVAGVGEITGDVFRVISTAILPADGKVAARIMADMLIDSGIIYVISWTISK